MRTLAKIVVVGIFLIGGTALAGQDTETISLLNGVYSVDVPVGWYYEQDEFGVANVSPEKGSPYSVIFLPPNPDVEGDIEEYAGIITGALIAPHGGEVTNEEELDFNGNRAVMFHFAIPAGEGVVHGIGNVVDFDGYGVLCLAVGPEDEFEEFFEYASGLMGTYQIDEDELEENAQILQQIADHLVEELATLFN